MRIISYNVNGFRAALSKGFADWLKTDPADIICLQETKAREEDVDLASIERLGYHIAWFSAQKKGYSGVAIFSKWKPDKILTGSNMPLSDAEGRVIRADFKYITVVNAYFPSGTSGDERQQYKYVWLEEFDAYIAQLRKLRKKIIVVGDYNIAHREIDIHDPKGNKNSSGFLPEERAWMDKWLNGGMIDTFRELYPQQTGAYSWWSMRFPSVRQQNKGWRIDYICVSANMKTAIKSAAIYPMVKHSDHCPVFAQLNIE